MKNREKIKRAERLEIAILLDKKYSYRSIAKALSRSPNAISYEVQENSVNGTYNPIKAHAKAKQRKRMSKFQWMKIEESEEVNKYVIEGLKNHWNPDEISGAMRKENKPFYASKTAIYDWLRSDKGQYYCKYLYSKRYYKKRRKNKKTKRAMIPERVSIDKRFLGANNRTRYGHWERDAITSGKKGSGSLAVAQERKSRFITTKKTRTMSPAEHNEKTKEMATNMLVKSYTYDNGIENKNHKELGIPAFFCDSRSSWQKGGVENANKMIRRYIPKGTDISKISDEYVQNIVDRINKKPRKILGYRSALEVARANGVLLKNNESVLIEG